MTVLWEFQLDEGQIEAVVAVLSAVGAQPLDEHTAQAIARARAALRKDTP